MTLEEVLEEIEKRITAETYHVGNVVTIEIGNDITLEDEFEMYLKAVETLHFKNCGFVKVKMKREVEA